MKSLTLKNTSFQYLEESFRDWLSLLGYASSTVESLPNYLREFLFYLESEEKISNIKQLDNNQVSRYYNQLQYRTNRRTGSGSISASYLNKHQQAIRLFYTYLRQNGRIILPLPHLKNEIIQTEPIEILTENEVGELFDAIGTIEVKQGMEFLRARDRAILAVYYCCGLRRSEGVQLNLKDIDLDRRIIHVRKAKNYKPRFVPIGSRYVQFFEEYIQDSRPYLTNGANISAFFVSERQRRLHASSVVNRLKMLVDEAGLWKRVSLHTLRHSIASHLLQNGMELHFIARFLGHESLESTQVYTHLVGVEAR